LATGVFGLKKAIQLALICDSAMALDDAEADAFAAVVPGAVVFGAELVLLLPQAPTPTPSAQASRSPDSARLAFIEMSPASPYHRRVVPGRWLGPHTSRTWDDQA
jgi:hypothetical protein